MTGNLHMGHMFEHTESDILIRWHRMRGERVLWIPGTDHAGIATQMLVERQITAKGTTRQQMGRENFRRARVGMAAALWRGDSRADEAAGRICRLGPRILHDGRAALGGGARGFCPAL